MIVVYLLNNYYKILFIQGLDYGAYSPYSQASTYASYYGQGYSPYGNGVPSTTALPGLSPTSLPAIATAAASVNSSVSAGNFPITAGYQLPHTLTSASSSLSGKLDNLMCLSCLTG